MNSQGVSRVGIEYRHDEPTSFSVKLLKTMMSIVRLKKILVKQMNKSYFYTKAAPMLKSLIKNYDVAISMNNDRKTWTIKPKIGVSEKVIIFIHGGGYVNNLVKYHWELIQQILAATDATIIIPDYPLAPEYGYEQVYASIMKMYTQLLDKVSANNVILMGDSAGGGFALGFAQQLKIDGKPQPSQIILISPWLDVTMSNPEILKVDKTDKMLSIEGLVMAGKAYAKELDTRDFKVSPIYGDFTGLGKISVFIGTHDVLFPDCQKLKAILDEKNIALNYFVYPKMFHDWLLVTYMKESRSAIRQLVSLIAANS